MRRTRIALVLALAWSTVTAVAGADTPTLPPPQVRAWQTGLLRPDRLRHASLAFSLAVGTGLVAREPAAATGAALGLGLLKEVWDMRPSGSGFDVVDLAADAIGAGAGTAVTAGIAR